MKNEPIKVTPCESAEEWKTFVKKCDDNLEMRMDIVARRVAMVDGLRFLGLTGPTCSGKTTAARKMTECLEEYGHRVHVISIDDFYFDKEHLHALAQENPDVEIDYDSEATIDIDLLREKAESLLACKETQLPRFDFKTGSRVDGVLIRPEPSDVFLFEGIQILYPRVREILNRGVYKCIYIYPASAIEQGGEVFDPDEIRLMRRLVRDSRYRGAKADFTFYLWQSVRANEDSNIFPYAHTCDYQINSTMPYEIGMLKPYLEELLDGFSEEDRFFAQAQEVLRQIRDIPPVCASFIRENSLYKEFI